MQNTTTTVQETQTRINAMKFEHILQELIDKDERIADLEADHAIAMMWFKETLHALAKVTGERDQARRVNRELRQIAKDLPASIEPPTLLMRPYMVKHRATAARDVVQ